MNVLKEIAQNALMALKPVQRFAMKRHSTGLNNNHESARRTYEFMRKYTEVRGRDVLELGPGQTMLLMHYALEDGARSCTAADASPPEDAEKMR